MSGFSKITVLPAKFEDADLDHLVVLIADILERLIMHNDKIPLSPESLTRFHSRTPPAISVLDYLRRVVKYSNVERACLLITLHYIDQICARVPRFTISSLTVHRFLISSITISSKALCDICSINSHYATVGGLQVVELNLLEKDLLAAIDWRLTCTYELLHEYYVNLVRTHSSGNFKLEEAEPSLTATTSEPSLSRSASPINAGADGLRVEDPESLVIAEPSSVLMGKTVSPPSSPPAQSGPSALEQNMAFAALQEQAAIRSSDSTILRPEKRSSRHLIDNTDVDPPRVVKRKLAP